mgnify:CR=1 FL=1
MSKKLDNDEERIKKACCSNILTISLYKQKQENLQKKFVLYFPFNNLRSSKIVAAYIYKEEKTCFAKIVA